MLSTVLGSRMPMIESVGKVPEVAEPYGDRREDAICLGKGSAAAARRR